MTISITTLACGLPLITEVMPGVQSAAISWHLPAGTSTEPIDRLGISAMWSELLMRGAGALDSRASADAFDRLGASRAASAGNYHLTLGSTTLGSRVERVLPLLVDIIREPRFEESAIEPTRDLALQALESIKDDPSQLAGLEAKRRHFAPPHNRSPRGSHDGLTQTTREDLVNGWKLRARPRGSILAIAGAIDPTSIIHTLDRLLAGWEGAFESPRVSGTPERGYSHLTDQTHQVQILVLHDAPREPDDDSLLEKIVVNVLSGGMAGRLFTEVREKRGLCYSVSAGYGGGRDFGALQAYVGTTPERAQQSLDVLSQELLRINKGDVTPEEFQRAVIGMKSRLVFSGESTGARAGALAADYFRLGRARSLADHAAQLDAVTLDQVNAYCRRRVLGKWTIQTLGPSPLTAPTL